MSSVKQSRQLKHGIMVLWETLKEGKQGASQQYRYMIWAFRTALLWFKVFLVVILATMLGFFIILGKMVYEVHEGRPVSHTFQLWMLFLAQVIPWFYSTIANTMFMYDDRHKGKSEHAKVPPRQWLRFFLTFWLMTAISAGGAYLYTLMYNWLASKFASSGLLATVPSTAAAQAVFVIYGQFSTYANAWGTRLIDPEAKDAWERERLERQSITRAERRENRRKAAQYKRPVGRWAAVGVMLVVATPVPVVTGLVPSLTLLVKLLLAALPVVVTAGNKLWVESLASTTYLHATKGFLPAQVWDFVWKNVVTYRLQIISIADAIITSLVPSLFVTVVVDMLLGNTYPQVHTALMLIIGILLAPFISPLMAKAPGEGDRAAKLVKDTLEGGSGPAR